MPHTFPTAGIPNRLVGRTPWSALDALVPPVREESIGCETDKPTGGSAADEGVRPTICATVRKRETHVALGFTLRRTSVRLPNVSLAGWRASGPPGREDYPRFNNPIVLPSKSENHANVPVGIFTGGTTVLPPNAVALSRQAWTSSTST